MARYVVIYILILVIMLAIDAVWLTLTAGPLYRATIGDALLDSFRPLPAIAFYLLFVAGLLIFVIPAADAPQDFGRVATLGALFGLVAYSTYDLTNFATLRNWSLALTVADMAWGTLLTAVGSTLGLLAGNAVLRLLRL